MIFNCLYVRNDRLLCSNYVFAVFSVISTICLYFSFYCYSLLNLPILKKTHHLTTGAMIFLSLSFHLYVLIIMMIKKRRQGKQKLFQSFYYYYIHLSVSVGTYSAKNLII